MSQESFEDIRFESSTLNLTQSGVDAHPSGGNNRRTTVYCRSNNKKSFYRIMRRMAFTNRIVLFIMIIVTLSSIESCVSGHKYHSNNHISSRRRQQQQQNRARAIFHLLSTNTHYHSHNHYQKSSSSLSSSSPQQQQQHKHRAQQTQQSHRHPYYFHYDHDENAGSKVQHIFRRWTPTTATTSTSTSTASSTTRQSRARIEKQSTSSVNADAKILYQLNRITSDDQLPVCDAYQVCNKIDTYSSPWIEKQCRCPDGYQSCSQSLSINDGHTIAEKSTRQYKICEPVRKLPICRFFRDITWTITTTEAKSESSLNSLLISGDDISTTPTPFTNEAENITRQEMKCQCPPNSVAYISKHQVYKSPDGQLGYRYSFACSPETKLRCRRKEPCRLFTARKRPKVEEVTTNTLCQCGVGYTCPSNHRHASVLLGTAYPLDNIKTFSGYCHPDPSALPIQDEDETGEGVTESSLSSFSLPSSFDKNILSTEATTTTTTTTTTEQYQHSRQHHSHHHKTDNDDSIRSLLR